MTEAPKDSNGRLLIDSPRWLQDTFTGRAKHFFNVTDPRNLFANDATLEAAKTLVEKYRLGIEPAGTLDEEVWTAKKIYSSAFHPDTGEKQLLIGRMSAQVPMNMTITGAMMTFYKTTPAVIFWQWINQSFNAVVNYTNRSGDQPISTKMLSQAYVSATGAALIVALGLNSMVKSLPPLVGRYVPFAAVAAANCVNIPLMRQRELLHGIPVFDDNGNRLGESKVAARHAVVMTVFSRIVMASPGMEMESIFHEKQEGALCAQHCLNSLLQGPYFNAVDLATIAKNLDDAERQRMAEGSVNSMEYYNFMQQPSSNMDDSGYFSIQVICKALEVWNLEMIQYNSPAAEQTRQNPVAETAYICNQQNHWLTIRKLGQQWFNLNSIKSNPELISDTYLSLLLAQLQAEGYSIYVIVGTFPECEAEQLLRLCPVSTEDYKQFANSQRLKNSVKKENPEQTDKTIVIDSEPAIPVDAAAVRDKRLNFFEKLAEKKSEPSNEPMNNVNDMSEEEMLKVAMEMSLEPME